jgi:hypothetical protein
MKAGRPNSPRSRKFKQIFSAERTQRCHLCPPLLSSPPLFLCHRVLVRKEEAVLDSISTTTKGPEVEVVVVDLGGFGKSLGSSFDSVDLLLLLHHSAYNSFGIDLLVVVQGLDACLGTVQFSAQRLVRYHCNRRVSL